VHKLLAIAGREYKAAVKTKAFVISLLLVPILWAVSIGVQVLLKKAEDRGTKTFAVVDRTADKQVTAALRAALKEHNEKDVYDRKTGEQNDPKYEMTPIEPSPPDNESILRQRYDLSQRCQRGEFEGFLEIGPDVYALGDRPPHDDPAGERRDVRYQTNKPGAGDLGRWLARSAYQGVLQHRFVEHNVSTGLVQQLQKPPPFEPSGQFRPAGRVDRAHVLHDPGRGVACHAGSGRGEAAADQ
jgi:ABC-2 type transport system permease protein